MKFGSQNDPTSNTRWRARNLASRSKAIFNRRFRGPNATSNARRVMIVTLGAMLVLSLYGTLLPSSVRCGLPGAVGCPGGILGLTAFAGSTGEQWFNVTMPDWGFWIYDSTTGQNESNSWNVYEGWTIHINATSLPPNAAIGGTAYHGLGIEINATGQQLLSLAAPVGRWVTGTFVAPTQPYYNQHIWCTIQCGPGHGSQHAWILNVVSPTILPAATVSASPTSGAAPLAVNFTASVHSGTPPYNISWSFGDGASGYTANMSHTYSQGGTYYPTLNVVDSKGEQGSAGLTILVGSVAPLKATLTGTPSSGGAPLGVHLSTVTHGGAPPYNYSWAFGDGITGSGSNATSHLYSSPGIYAAAVTVTDSSGTTTRSLASIQVKSSAGTFPVSVKATPSNGSAPLQVIFTASPSGGTAPYTYYWVFGDGTTATSNSVAHMYNVTGSYEATVFVTDSTGKVSTVTTNVPVTQGGGGGCGSCNDTLPAAAPTRLTLYLLTIPPSGAAPLTASTIASIQGGTGKGESVHWTFGDGSTGSGQVASHVFSSTGTYSVSVTANDSGANVGAGSTTVYVGQLQASIALNLTQGDSPLSVLAGASIQGGSGSYPTVQWSWGDGGSSSGFLSNHTYADTTLGAQTIGLSVTDSAGTKATASASVRIFPAPLATVTRQLGSLSPPVPVVFHLNVSGGSGVFPHPAQWDFGDRSSTQGPWIMTHNYTSGGHFQVIVISTDSLGGVAIATTWVNISGPGGAAPISTAPPVWSFTGVADPDQAALILLGLIAITGLGLLARKRQKSKAKAAAARAPRPPSARTTAAAPQPPKET